MKKVSINVSWIVVVAGLIGLVSATDARAGDEKLVAHVPFAFAVGDANLPPGSYVVREATDDPGVLEIVNADGNDAAFAITIPAADRNLNGTPQAQLVFVKRDGQVLPHAPRDRRRRRPRFRRAAGRGSTRAREWRTLSSTEARVSADRQDGP